MRKQTKSLLTELDELLTHKDKENVLESRATHIIMGAINLIQNIKESYDLETATKLENRLINAIKGRDPKKFTRGIRKVRDED